MEPSIHLNTPEYISGPEELPENSIFVFGSNTQGIHGTGSAKTAIDNFGAIYGRSDGLQGSSYAICTTELRNKTSLYPLSFIAANIVIFLEFAKEHPDLLFWMTKIGTLRAGHSIEDIADIFYRHDIPKNVILPIEFEKEPQSPETS